MANTKVDYDPGKKKNTAAQGVTTPAAPQNTMYVYEGGGSSKPTEKTGTKPDWLDINATKKPDTTPTGGGGYVEEAVDYGPAADDGRGSVYASLPQFQAPDADPQLKMQYENAMAALEAAKGKAPTYGSQYDAQIQSLYNQILGRDKFKYDSKTDPLYQQYVQDYTQQGKMAMRDTMGQAAGLTGGYGSSYGQAVGQQQYDAYLQRMADILPQTYGMALDAYNAEGNRIQQQLDTTRALEESDYGRYLDKLSQYNRDLALAQDAEQLAYNRMTDADKTAYNRALDAYEIASDEEKLKYARSQDYYNRLLGLMSMGYNPTAQEYEDAGLTAGQGALLRKQYLDSQKPVYSGGSPTNQTDRDDQVMSTMQDGFASGGATKLYTIADLENDYNAAKGHSNKVADFGRAYDLAVKSGMTEFDADEWRQFKETHHI